MKKLLFLTIFICAVILSGCNTPTEDVQNTQLPTQCTVTFRQDGQADVTRIVGVGDALADIPMPVDKTGYTVSWDRADFSTVTEDIIVNAVETANEYEITFNLYSTWGTVDFDMQSTTLVFDGAYDLGEPSLYGFLFVGWEIEETGTEFAENGVYTVADDITLIPKWEKDEDSYRWWGHLV